MLMIDDMDIDGFTETTISDIEYQRKARQTKLYYNNAMGLLVKLGFDVNIAKGSL